MSSAAMAAETSALVPERPDLAWIKKNVPIEDVARKLGLDVTQHRAHCWRVENHRNGDADPSLRFHRRKNRARCFVCDLTGGFSNIDLVIGILNGDFPSAVAWICERFPVPQAKRGRPLGPRYRWNPNFRVGTTGSELELLVRFGLWAELTPTQQKILPVLLAFTDVETGGAEISYRGLMRFAGVRSPKSIARAVWGLQSLHAVRVDRSQGAGVVRGCSSYRLTLDDPQFVRLLNDVHRHARVEIERERAFRAQLRSSREKVAPARFSSTTSAASGSGGSAPRTPPCALSPQTSKPPDSCTGELLCSPSEALSNKPLHRTEPRGMKTARKDGYESPNEAECLRRAQKQKAELDAWLAARQQAPQRELSEGVCDETHR